jgi:hypothetical protein
VPRSHPWIKERLELTCAVDEEEFQDGMKKSLEHISG